MVAIEDPAKVSALLDAGANPNAHSVAGRTALINASDRKRSASVIKLLIEHGASTDREAGQADPMLQVTRNGDLESMQLLVAKRNGKFSKEALTSAALSNCMECLQLVLAQNPSKQAISDALAGAAIMARTEVLAVFDRGGCGRQCQRQGWQDAPYEGGLFRLCRSRPRPAAAGSRGGRECARHEGR